jgi:hypothetical protein
MQKVRLVKVSIVQKFLRRSLCSRIILSVFQKFLRQSLMFGEHGVFATQLGLVLIWHRRTFHIGEIDKLWIATPFASSMQLLHSSCASPSNRTWYAGPPPSLQEAERLLVGIDHISTP